MEKLFLILITFVVAIIATYQFTKVGMIDDAIKYFKENFLKRK